MTREEHIAKHKELHRALDQLIADFIDHTENLPSKTNLLVFMTWAHEQTICPTEKEPT